MHEKTIGILSLVTGIAFGAISTWAVLKPDEHLRLYKGQTLLSYQDRTSEILEATNNDPYRRLEALTQFEERIAFFRDPEDETVAVFFAALTEHQQQAEADISAREAAADEAERQRLLAEEQAREEERVKREQEELAAQRARLEQLLARERICLDQNCTNWILP